MDIRFFVRLAGSPDALPGPLIKTPSPSHSNPLALDFILCLKKYGKPPQVKAIQPKVLTACCGFDERARDTGACRPPDAQLPSKHIAPSHVHGRPA